MQSASGPERKCMLMYDLLAWAVFQHKDISVGHVVSEYAQDWQF